MTEQTQDSTVEEKRIVTMNDGSTVDFKKRNNVIQSIDLENNEVTFSVFTGETLKVDLTAIPSEVKDLIFAKGVVNILKSNLAGVKLQDEKDGVIENTLAIALQKGIDSLLAGKVSLRSASEDDEVLSDDEKFFAVSSTFERSPSYKPEWVAAVKEVDGKYLFNDEVDGAILSEIATTWAGFDRKERNKARRNPYFTMAAAHNFEYLLSKASA